MAESDHSCKKTRGLQGLENEAIFFKEFQGFLRMWEPWLHPLYHAQTAREQHSNLQNRKSSRSKEVKCAPILWTFKPHDPFHRDPAGFQVLLVQVLLLHLQEADELIQITEIDVPDNLLASSLLSKVVHRIITMTAAPRL